MLFNLISNINNGAGLEVDCQLIKEVLLKLGHQVCEVHFQRDHQTVPKADVNLWVEIIVPPFSHASSQNWIFPNPEWFAPSWLTVMKQYGFQKIFCKTRDCYRIFNRYFSSKELVFTGFFSKDLYDKSIKKRTAFLHAAGKSTTKNTQACIDCWNQGAINVPLIVISDLYSERRHGNPTGNIEYLTRVSPDRLKTLMNECEFHLMPSGYEGYGHSLHEGMGCKGIVLTLGVAPMLEFGTCPKLFIRSTGNITHGMALLNRTDAGAIREVVFRALELSHDFRVELGEQARKRFLEDKDFFIDTFSRAIGKSQA
jgi:hypothetical protein